LLSLPLACGDDDSADDDDSTDDDTSFDDDFSDDDSIDDDGVDDDTFPDDDTIDDDTDDDDDDDDTGPTELMILGETDEGEFFSLRQKPEGWVREDFPLSRRYDMSSMGSSFFYRGRQGWASVNYLDGIMYNTTGYDLLVYDPQSGWSLDEAHAPPEDDLNLVSLFAPQQDVLWLTAVSYGHLWLNFSLWAYGDGAPVHVAPGTNGYMYMDFSAPDNGYFVGFKWLEYSLIGHFNGAGIQQLTMPPEYVEGAFWNLWLIAEDEGFFLWTDSSWSWGTLLHMHDGQWEAVEAPPGCADPGIVYAWMVGGSVMPDYDYLIIPVYCAGENDVLWEYSGGQWTCREQEGMTRIASTMALRDGRVFLLGADDGSAVLYELFADHLEEIELPLTDFTPTCLQAVGPLASRYRNCNMTFE